FNILTSALLGGHKATGYNGFDFSIPVGLAYQFGRHFELGARYDISTVKYHPRRTGSNSVWSVNVAWRF
ncbi:MAG: outer membrane beta-barrel protein, partial [Mucinivorans sp.]